MGKSLLMRFDCIFLCAILPFGFLCIVFLTIQVFNYLILVDFLYCVLAPASNTLTDHITTEAEINLDKQ